MKFLLIIGFLLFFGCTNLENSEYHDCLSLPNSLCGSKTPLNNHTCILLNNSCLNLERCLDLTMSGAKRCRSGVSETHLCEFVHQRCGDIPEELTSFKSQDRVFAQSSVEINKIGSPDTWLTDFLINSVGGQNKNISHVSYLGFEFKKNSNKVFFNILFDSGLGTPLEFSYGAISTEKNSIFFELELKNNKIINFDNQEISVNKILKLARLMYLEKDKLLLFLLVKNPKQDQEIKFYKSWHFARDKNNKTKLEGHENIPHIALVLPHVSS